MFKMCTAIFLIVVIATLVYAGGMTQEVSNEYTVMETLDTRFAKQIVAIVKNVDSSYGLVCRVKAYASSEGDLSSYFPLSGASTTQLTLEAGEQLLLLIVNPWAKLEIEAKNKLSGEVSDCIIERMVKK